MGLFLIIFTICVFNVPSTDQHFFNDVDSEPSDSELFETAVSMELLPKSRFELGPESKNPKHVLESARRRKRSVTSPYQIANNNNNNNAAMFLPQQHAGNAYYNRPLDSSWNYNRYTTNQFPSTFYHPSSTTYIGTRPNVATYANPYAPMVSVASLQPKDSSTVLQTPGIITTSSESNVGYALHGDQNYDALKTPPSESYLDSNNERPLDLEPSYLSKYVPVSIPESIITQQHAKIPVIMSGEEFFGTNAKDLSGASDTFKPQTNYESNVHIVSGSDFFPEEPNLVYQPHQEYISAGIPLSIEQTYPELMPIQKVEVLNSASEEDEMKMRKKQFDGPTRALQALAEKAIVENAYAENGYAEKALDELTSREKEHHHTDPISQSDLGIAASLIRDEQVELASGVHDAIHHPTEQKTSEDFDDEPVLKQNQYYHTSHNPYQHKSYGPNGESFHTHGNVESDYGANYYQATPEHSINVYQEEVALPSSVEVPEKYDFYWGKVDNHRVLFEEPWDVSEEDPAYFISTPKYFTDASESDKKNLRKKLLRKMVKKPKKPKTVGRKMMIQDDEEDPDESPRRKPEKLRGFVRLLDTITRIVPDDIVDRIMNRSWDRLYRGHKNCWRCDKE